jgi:hypothetical protein
MIGQHWISHSVFFSFFFIVNMDNEPWPCLKHGWFSRPRSICCPCGQVEIYKAAVMWRLIWWGKNWPLFPRPQIFITECCSREVNYGMFSSFRFDISSFGDMDWVLLNKRLTALFWWDSGLDLESILSGTYWFRPTQWTKTASTRHKSIIGNYKVSWILLVHYFLVVYPY